MATLAEKILEGLERLSVLHRHLLWEAAYAADLTATQAQILLHLAEAQDHISSLTLLAQMMHMSHGTISDATRTLVQKKLVNKQQDPLDKRKFVLALTKKGEQQAKRLQSFSQPLLRSIGVNSQSQNTQLYQAIVGLIYQLHLVGRFPTQRMCYTCKHYQEEGKTAYCRLLEQRLDAGAIRLNCAEHELN